jgi:hypothetical protein
MSTPAQRGIFILVSSASWILTNRLLTPSHCRSITQNAENSSAHLQGQGRTSIWTSGSHLTSGTAIHHQQETSSHQTLKMTFTSPEISQPPPAYTTPSVHLFTLDLESGPSVSNQTARTKPTPQRNSWTQRRHFLDHNARAKILRRFAKTMLFVLLAVCVAMTCWAFVQVGRVYS